MSEADNRMEELADRVERAGGADHELDLAIWELVDPRAAETIAAGRRPLEWLHCYTSDLNAAMSLVPEGFTAWELRSRLARTRFVAELSRMEGDEEIYTRAHAATPALALTAAALRSRVLTDPHP